MTHRHLSDEEMQILALGQQIEVPGIKQHLDGCTSCREQVALYKMISSGIKAQPPAAFEFDLTTAVLQQIQPARNKKTGVNLWPVFFIVFALIPLYIFRRNFLNLATGISVVFLVVSLLACTGIIISRVYLLYQSYQRQIEKLNFSE